ncbi:MAG: S8 family peptidase [Geitlerinemataceae cyanobacterium]
MKRFLLALLFCLGLGWAIASFDGLASQGTYDSLVLDFREDIAPAEVERAIGAIADEYGLAPRFNSEFSAADNVYIVRGDAALLDTLRQELRDVTEFVEPNYVYSIPEISAVGLDGGGRGKDSGPTVPNDPLYAKQWNFKAIGVEQAWLDSNGGGVTVAVIDTGVSPVPDLKETELADGYDFVNDRPDATDDNGHGTHVAGTIAQSTNNGYGVAGIAHGATIMPLKVLGKGGGGTVADIAEAIRFAADNGADVINMSLGGGGESSLMKEAIEHAHSQGVVVIAAAGNANQNSAGYPARYERVVGVSAVDSTGAKAPYSNFGAGVDIAAPGGNTKESQIGGILQNTIDAKGESVFASLQGTSMAAPHVAGVAALVKAAGIDDPDEIREIVLQSALEPSDDPLNHFGAGKLDAAAAVKLAIDGQITPRDFARWLRDNGYLNPKFWIDGGVVALPMKLAMVIGGYLLAWLLRVYFPFRWSWPLATGIVMGSSGLFFLRGFYIFDLPQWPLRVAGSSIPELGTAVQGSAALNPIFASVLIPAGLLVLLLGHRNLKWWAIGSLLGVSACLAVSAVADPELLWLGKGFVARGFLGLNALLCFGLAKLSLRPSET